MVEEDPEDFDKHFAQLSADELYSDYFRQAIESGMRDSDAGRVTDHNVIRHLFGLD